MEAHRFSLGGFIVGWVARLLYLSALTVLIPFGALLITSGLSKIPEAIRQVPITALALVGVSAIILFLYHHSIAHTLASLGWMTLLPGIGGLLLMLVGREAIFGFISRFFAGFSLIEPLLTAVQESLPKIWLFAVAYIIIGLMLIHTAGKIDHQHALRSQLRNLFGPRVRIFKSH